MQRATETRSNPTLLLCAAIVLAGPASLAAQDTRWPEPGERVRFVSDSISGDSRVAAVFDESLLLEGDSAATRFVVPRDALRRLEVFRGRTSRLKGLLVGGAAGSLLGTFVAIPCRSQPHYTCRSASALDRTLLGAGVGALVGAVAWGGREIWEEIRLRGAPGRTLLAGRDDDVGTGMDTITREEIAAFREGDAMQIVRRLRPGWLRPRTQATITSAVATAAALDSDSRVVPDPAVYPEVFEGHLHYGPAESLRAFDANEIERLERVSALDATTLYGTGYVAGIIRVITRR